MDKPVHLIVLFHW